MKIYDWRVLGLGFFLLITGLWVPEDSEAIPAFARKYGVKCTTCHVQFPKLNKFGIVFKNRGYRMKGEEGDFLWKSKIIPLAAIARFGYVYTDSKVDGVHTQTSEGVDSGIELFSGGTLAPRISYFIDALTDANAPLVQFDDILPNSALNLKVGDFNVDNYYLSNPRRFTESTYLIQTSAAGMASGSAAAGSGSRDDNVTFTNLGGELNGQFIEQGFRYALGVGNGNSGGSEDLFGQMFYVILNQDIMEHTVSFLFRGDKIGDADDNLTPPAALAAPDDTNNTYTIGGNIQFSFFQDRLNIIVGAYQFFGGEFLNFTEPGRTATTYEALSGTVEATYLFTEKLLGLGRFDWHDTHDSSAYEEQWVASLQYHFVPNVKLNLEYVHLDSNAGGNVANAANVDSDTLRMNVRFGF